MHKKLKYVYIVQAFVFVKKSYFGGHLECHFDPKPREQYLTADIIIPANVVRKYSIFIHFNGHIV